MKNITKLIANAVEYCVCSRSQSDNNLPNPHCLNCGKKLP